MDIETGCSLAIFINGNSTRFSAKVLDFGQKAWVIIRDNEADHSQQYAEPIADVVDYLARGEGKVPPMDAEYRSLLLSWVPPLPDEARGATAESDAAQS
jgi:hypothetical protein